MKKENAWLFGFIGLIAIIWGIIYWIFIAPNQ
jgi:hypothetical protein